MSSQKGYELLKKSPLFNLSLASKELFHSNFIQWYGHTFPERFGEIIRILINKGTESLVVKHIDREKENIDLLIHCELSGAKFTVVVENKVKSIPSNEQLNKYAKKVKADAYLLLTFVKPLKELPSPWKLVPYPAFLSQLCTEKYDSCDSSGYYQAIVKDYKDFTQALFDLVNHILNGERYFHDDCKQLKYLRIDDLIGKGQAFSVAQMLYLEYPDGVFGPGQKIPGKIYIEHSFSNTEPMVSLYQCFESSEGEPCYFAGVQVQHGNIRICGYAPCANSKDRRAEKFMNFLCTDVWDDLSDYQGARNRRQNPYCVLYYQYNINNVGMFLYKEKPLENYSTITKAALADEINMIFKFVTNNKAEIERKIRSGEFSN